MNTLNRRSVQFSACAVMAIAASAVIGEAIATLAD